MTVSKMPNWPAVRVPIMTQRGPRPVRHSLAKPISRAMLIRRDTVPPLPPLQNNDTRARELVHAALHSASRQLTRQPC